VVHQSIDADVERCRHRAQRGLSQAVLRQILDDAIEQFLTTLEIGGAGHGRSP
jgi:hypothetical protein